jgi:hypothetical protein
MPRRLLPLLFAAFLLAPPAQSQQTPNQQPSTRRHSKGGGSRGGGSGRSGDSGGVPPMKELPCPHGFTAVTDSGPHLVIAAQAQAKGGRKKNSSQEADGKPAMKKTLARRCVPDKPKKAAASKG